ncbi:MAG TPA: glycoside hydrolase family 1 protein [Candidatus Omnitrophota bacterium]|nr:glycoside hydrolase family 1 protein [Candidatus Omnitrophota bacterium]
MIRFPKDFLWGSATSSHQVEGDNRANDWWEWEQKGHGKQPSGEACRHYQLYEKDFDLAQQLHHNCHRLSIEWSRIQPDPDSFSESAIAHYQQVINALRARGMEPIVTLHHFTNPRWLARIGGWENKRTVDYFCRYVEKMALIFSPRVRYWVTINEPLIYAYFSYFAGDWPPQKKSFLALWRVRNRMIAAHIKAYRAIHRIYKQAGLPRPMVGVAHHLMAFVACEKTFRNRLAVSVRNSVINLGLLKVLAARSLDFIGINYYSRNLIDTENWSLHSILSAVCRRQHDILPKNEMGWEIYPRGLYDMLLSLKRYRLPVFILENGVCVSDDRLRWDFIREHLKSVACAIEQGVDVRGYMYWSLLDNFEWDKGFVPRFGLIGIDYQTFERTVRDSARRFAQVCKTGILD